MNILMRPIGFLRSSFKEKWQIRDKDEGAFIEIKEDLKEGLIGLDGFSHIIVIFVFHKSEGYSLLVKPPRHNPKNNSYGVFATRAPYRPNPIGFSIVKLHRIENNVLFVTNKDMLDGTPILDIKPYLPEDIENPSFGWYKDF